MAKRAREDDGDSGSNSLRPSKRSKLAALDHLSRLSDELIVRVFSYLSESQLVICERLSHKYRHLAGDSQLWRNLYYERFVRPRANRLPGGRENSTANDRSHVTARPSKWLDEEHLLKRKTVNWKRQFKLRRNWSKGTCAVSEIPVAEDAAVPPILVQMHDGVIYSTDQTDGLRAWSAKERRLVAHHPLRQAKSSPPTSIAVNTKVDATDTTVIVIGFEDGSFSLFALRKPLGKLNHLYSHPGSDGVITGAAISFPYVLTMTATQQLSLYRFEQSSADPQDVDLKPPQLLHSLKSHTIWPPLSTSLRASASAIFVCVAYALPTYLSGWTVGIQEIKITPEGKVLDSRIASAIDQHYRPLAFTTRPVLHHLTPFTSASHSASATIELRHIHSKPTSLSYTHPYLLVSHPDNTLTIYMVTSTEDSLFISPGSRLWGHTSAVSGAHVGGRGKAVSVSRRGDELRVWELEGGFSSSAAKKRLATGGLSVQIRAETDTSERSTGGSGIQMVNKAIAARLNGPACSTEDRIGDNAELTLTRGWVGFDDENVVVLKERPQGEQALVVYDFT